MLVLTFLSRQHHLSTALTFIALFLSEIKKIIDQRPRVYEFKVDDNVNEVAVIANKTKQRGNEVISDETWVI